MKTVIGITVDYSEKQVANGGYSDKPWYAIRTNYAQVVASYGVTVILLPYIDSSIDDYLSICDGILLPGGDYDIDPTCYGEVAHKQTNTSNGIRENFEFKLMRKAMNLETPILAICAGQQLLNVLLGGNLIQHLPDYVHSDVIHKHNGDQAVDWHDVNIIEDTLLHKIVGISKYKINSHHHQAVGRLGRDLRINAVAPDGVIEGIEHIKLPFCMGIEWHPEHCNNEYDKKIFDAFVKAAEKYHSNQ